MPRADLVAEHAALARGRTELETMIQAEWLTMDAVTAKHRYEHLGKIDARLATIERSQACKDRKIADG